ncbi:unnamed protein product [Orchesella dallaii]|uniref:Uncharacterized protein n=1 Tax=Orchesella dallaii TaxID=48710 RepID=A0ABP1QHY4_9HEXA
MGSCVGVIRERWDRRRVDLSYTKLQKYNESNQTDFWTPILRDESQELLNVATLQTKPQAPTPFPQLQSRSCVLNHNCLLLKSQPSSNNCEGHSFIQNLKLGRDDPALNSFNVIGAENVSMIEGHAVAEQVGATENLMKLCDPVSVGMLIKTE